VINKSFKKIIAFVLTVILCSSFVINSFSLIICNNDGCPVDYIRNPFSSNQKALFFEDKDQKQRFVSLYNDAIKHGNSYGRVAKSEGVFNNNIQATKSKKFFLGDYVLVTKYVLYHLYNLMTDDFVYTLKMLTTVAKDNNTDVILIFNDKELEKLNDCEKLKELKENLVGFYNSFDKYQKNMEYSFYLSDFYDLFNDRDYKNIEDDLFNGKDHKRVEDDLFNDKDFKRVEDDFYVTEFYTILKCLYEEKRFEDCFCLYNVARLLLPRCRIDCF